MAATAVTLRDALSKILGQDDSDLGRARASSRSPPAPPPSPSLLRSSEFEFEKLFHSPGSDYMDSEPGSPSTSDCDLSIPCVPSSCGSLAVPLCSNHHAYHSNHHGNGLASSCICQISRQTEALSVSFPSDGSHSHPSEHSGSAASSLGLGLSGPCSNASCVEERLLDMGFSQTEKRERKISLKRNHDDISMDDCCYADSDSSWLVIDMDRNKKSCQERSCIHASSRSSPKHSRRQPALVSSVPSTSDYAHDHASGQASNAQVKATSAGSYPHWPNGFSRHRTVVAGAGSGQVLVSSMGMSSAGVVTRTSVGFDEQQMDCQDDDSRPSIPVVTRIDDMDCDSSVPQYASSPFSFNAQVPAASSSGPGHSASQQPFPSFRPHAHTFSGFKTSTNVTPSPSLAPSGLMNAGMAHLGVPDNFSSPRSQQFDFFSFHEPSGGGLPSSPQDLFSKSL